MTDPLLPKFPLVPTRGYLLRRGLLVGGALGMLIGLIWVGVTSGPDGSRNIIVWRNFILAGFAVGAIVGLLLPIPPAPTETDDHD